VELLDKAVTGGFRVVTAAAQDSEVDPLRYREDLRKLLAGLTKRAPDKP
jgi:hypothetical protein